MPAWDRLPAPPPEATLISDLVQLQFGGIELLESVAVGAYAASLDCRQAGPTEKRTAKACQVSRGLVAMSNSGLDRGMF